MIKSFLKFALVFLLGLIIGGGVGGYFVGNYMKEYLQKSFGSLLLSSIAYEIHLLQVYREGVAERDFKSIENAIPDHVLTVTQNEEVKNSLGGDQVLINAKRFYKCTKTPVPKEISTILEKVKLNGLNQCRSEDEKAEDGENKEANNKEN